MRQVRPSTPAVLEEEAFPPAGTPGRQPRINHTTARRPSPSSVKAPSDNTTRSVPPKALLARRPCHFRSEMKAEGATPLITAH